MNPRSNGSTNVLCICSTAIGGALTCHDLKIMEMMGAYTSNIFPMVKPLKVLCVCYVTPVAAEGF